jgi:penicillin-binding protein 1C
MLIAKKIRKGVTFFLFIFLLLASIPIFFLRVPIENHKNSLIVLDRNGIELYEFLGRNSTRSQWLSFEEISPWLVKTTIFREDRYFYKHFGVNPLSLLRAGVTNLKNRKFMLGGSTITMQVAKMMEGRKGKNIWKKIKEILLAVKLEILWSKKDIISYYLNRVYYGNQLFGCESASQFYFGKSARELTLAQSAFLSVIPSSPSSLNPYKNLSKLEIKAKSLIKEMYLKGWIKREDYEIAMAEKIEIKKPFNPLLAPHFVFRILKEEEENLYNYSEIKTTIDYYLQREAQNILKIHLENLKEKGVGQGAIIVMENKTGEILVWVGSKDFWDEESSGQIDGCTIKRQPGSALKPFLYAVSFEKGFTPSTILPDIPTSFKEGNKLYVPRNYSNDFSGPVRLRVALASSLNVPAVHVLSKIGRPLFYRKLLSFGFESLERGDKFYGLGLALGSGEVALLELVRAYSAFARKGILIREKKVLSYKRRDGSMELHREIKGRRIFDEKVCFLITSILSDNYSRGLGFRENSPLNFPYQVAVKTGTSEGFRDNFCIGYTRDWTVGVWVGNFEGESMKNVSGVTGAGPIFHSIMDLLQRRKYGRIPYGEKIFEEIPKGIVKMEICPLSGMLPSLNCEGRISEYFIEGTEPKELCNWHRAEKIDLRNGLIAGEWTPKKFVKEKIFIFPPSLFTEWAMSKGVFPPKKISHLKEHDFKIVHPVDGSIFQTLPDLPKDYQSIRLELRTDITSKKVIWYVDDKILAISKFPFKERWQIERGAHEITAKLEDGKYEDRVRIYVQ